MTKFREFPEIEIPGWLPLGWGDMSYHNDACASLEFHPLGGESYPILVLWVAEDDPKDRELVSMGCPKYALNLIRSADDECTPAAPIHESEHGAPTLAAMNCAAELIRQIFRVGE